MEKKYQKSKSGYQCIGPCYGKNIVAVHPQLLKGYSAPHPQCPIVPVDIEDKATGKTITKIYDECYAPLKTEESLEVVRTSMATPDIYFDCGLFLKIYYNISAFNTSLEWITENKIKPVYTRLRIMNCALVEYHEEIKVADDRIIDFYIEVAKKLWLKELYSLLQTNIQITNGEIYIGKDTGVADNDTRVKKINFIIKKFINYDTMYNFLDSIISDKKKLKKMVSHYEMVDGNMKKEFISYVHEKVLSMANK